MGSYSSIRGPLVRNIGSLGLAVALVLLGGITVAFAQTPPRSMWVWQDHVSDQTGYGTSGTCLPRRTPTTCP